MDKYAVEYSLARVDIYKEKYKSFKVGMCQIRTEQWDIQGNLNRTLIALEEAAKQGAELAITPECVLHGYADINSEQDKQNLYQVSQKINGDIFMKIRNKVKELGIYAIVGFAEIDDNNKLFNSAAFISPDGSIINNYHKVHLRPFEDAEYDGCFTAGNNFYCHKVEFNQISSNIGTFICFDREITESARCLRSLGAEFIACPLATNTERLDNFKVLDNEIVTRVRAAENEVFIAVVNHAGRFNGGSFIVGPGGQVIAQLDEKEQVKIIDIPIEVVIKKYHNNTLGWMGYGYRKPEIYIKYMNK